MKNYLFIFLLSSCNIMKTLTGGETKVDDDFFDKNPGAEKNLLFFSCEASYPCFLDTASGVVTIMDTSLTQAKGYTFFDGKVYFSATNSSVEDIELYHYDFSTKTTKKFDLNTAPADSKPRSFQKFQGSLYFLAGADGVTGGGLCKLDIGASMPDCKGTYISASAYYLIIGHYNDYADSDLYVCYENSGARIHKVDTTDATSFAMATVVPASGPAIIDCSATLAGKGFGINSFLFETASSGEYLRYNISTNTLETQMGSLTAETIGVFASHTSKFYFDDAGVLKMIDTTTPLSGAFTVTTEGPYDPTHAYIEESDQELMFTDKDASDFDQVYRVSLTNLSGVPEKLTSFTGESILFMTGMRQGLFIVTPSRIIQMGERDIKDVFQGSISGEFTLIREHDMNRTF